jgi:3',5'-cyclic AMP phosphodiesterase CpdA
MDKVLVLSDVHMRSEGQTIIGLDPLARLVKALEHATDRHPDAQHLVLLGDIAHSGKIFEYERVKEAISRYTLNLILLPGNHDKRENLLKVFPDTPLDENGFVQSTVDIGDTRLVALDTLQEPHSVGPEHSGYLCPARLDWLRNRLDSAAGKRIVVFAHHPPHPVGFPAMDPIRLNNGSELLDLLASYQHVAHLLCGHVHRTISGSSRGVSFTVFKSPLHQMPMETKRADDTLSVPEPGAYGVIFLLPDTVTVHTEDFDLATTQGVSTPDALPE